MAQDKEARRWSGRIGPEVVHVTYKEPGVMQEAGFMYGAYAGGALSAGPMRYGLSASYVAGDLEYSANPSKYTVEKIELTTPGSILTALGTAGYSVSLFDEVIVLYAGVGYRLLSDDLPDAGALQGYSREQAYYFLPVGAAGSRAIPGWGRMDVEVEFDYLVRGENTSASETMIQDSGYGCRVGLRYVSQAGILSWLPSAMISAGPFFQYWNLEDSKVSDAGWMEPNNTSSAIGFQLGLEF